MSTKILRLQGLARIRRLQEEIERRALQLAVAAVAEVESALQSDAAAMLESRESAREALRAGDRSEWLLADAQGEVARANIDKLGCLLTKREAQVPIATARFLVCRHEHEQSKVLVRETRQAEAVEDARREQATADEWVISRWNRIGN
jgi:flagellar export protein FliJ